MKTSVLIILNLTVAAVFFFLRRRPGALSYSPQGRVWLTWPAGAVITLMDEFTSVFYSPAEAFRFIGRSLSSRLDRLALGVMMFNIMRLPRLFPQFEFNIR